MSSLNTGRHISARLDKNTAWNLQIIKELYTTPMTTPSTTDVLAYLINQHINDLRDNTEYRKKIEKIEFKLLSVLGEG